MLLMFVTAALLNAAQINRNYSSIFMDKLQDDTKSMTDYVRDELCEYKALPWLFSYWEENYAGMDIPVNGLEDENWIERHQNYYYYRVKTVTEAEALSMPEAEQKEFAETCYMKMAVFFDHLKQKFNMVGLYCSSYKGNNESFALFYGVDKASEGERYALGKMWPFHPELHPVADKIVRTGMDISEVEHVTSTTDGIEYMFVYTPVIYDGEVLALICETRHWTEVKEDITSNARKVEMVNSIVLLFIISVIMMLIYIVVIRPLFRVQGIVRRYKTDKESSSAGSDLKVLAEKENEIGMLAGDVAAMIESIDGYIDEVKSAAIEKERIGAELDMASGIQSASLPSKFPAFPERREFDIYAMMNPAKEIGGDFFDFFMTDEDHLVMVVADVSGKGVPAALFMMVSQTVIRSIAGSMKSPKDILISANQTLTISNSECMFVTVWLGILDVKTGKLVYADAGHEKPVVFHDGSWSLIEKVSGSVALGMLSPEDYNKLTEKYHFTDREIMMKPGDVLFQYTDGVTEANDKSENLFGEKRLLQALVTSEDNTPEVLLKHVRSRIDEFAQDTPQFDDITMLAIQFKGAGEGY